MILTKKKAAPIRNTDQNSKAEKKMIPIKKTYRNPKTMTLIILAPGIINIAEEIISGNIENANLNNISLKELWTQALKTDKFKNEILGLLKDSIRFFKKIFLVNYTERDEYLYFKDKRYVSDYKLL